LPLPPGQPPAGGAYERLAYPGFAYSHTHPARLEVIGRLFGLAPAPADAARVLELGCGDGGNALSLAAALPGATVLGIDASQSAIERGEAIREAALLGNAELRCMSIEELPQELGPFDYVLAHGVYSWIPEQARDALLAAARRLLTPDGIAFVSYNAYPGGHLRDMAREILRYHVRDIEDPQLRLQAAHELMQTIVAIDEPSPYARVLREHLERVLGFSDAFLFHDDLAEISTPFYLHEFVEHAGAHGLQFLCEADLADSQMRDVPTAAGALMASLPDDPVVREQYLDFFKNRTFRQTLLCQAEARVQRTLQAGHVTSCIVSAQLAAVGETEGGERFETPEGAAVTTGEPFVRAALHALAAAWPAGVPFDALLEATGSTDETTRAQLADIVFDAYLARIVDLRGGQPPLTATPSQRPCASALARAQLAAGLPAVSSLTHRNVRMDGELESALLPLLDGTRDSATLAATLAGDPGEITQALGRFASAGLLTA
jgi:SAM-dependent methyltransferase